MLGCHFSFRTVDGPRAPRGARACPSRWPVVGIRLVSSLAIVDETAVDVRGRVFMDKAWLPWHVLGGGRTHRRGAVGRGGCHRPQRLCRSRQRCPGSVALMPLSLVAVLSPALADSGFSTGSLWRPTNMHSGWPSAQAQRVPPGGCEPGEQGDPPPGEPRRSEQTPEDAGSSREQAGQMAGGAGTAAGPLWAELAEAEVWARRWGLGDAWWRGAGRVRGTV